MSNRNIIQVCLHDSKHGTDRPASCYCMILQLEDAKSVATRKPLCYRKLFHYRKLLCHRKLFCYRKLFHERSCFVAGSWFCYTLTLLHSNILYIGVAFYKLHSFVK